MVAVNVTDLTSSRPARRAIWARPGFGLANLNSGSRSRSRCRVRSPIPPTRICAYLPVADALALAAPAEILVLDPDPKKVVLGVMA